MLDQRSIDDGHPVAVSHDALRVSIDLDGRILGWSPSTFVQGRGASIDVHVTAVPVVAASGPIDRVDLVITRLEPIDPTSTEHAVEQRIARLARDCSLGTRDVEVLVLLAAAHRVATIARHLHLAQGTVRNRLSALYVKLGVRCQGEVVELLLGERSIDGRHWGAA